MIKTIPIEEVAIRNPVLSHQKRYRLASEAHLDYGLTAQNVYTICNWINSNYIDDRFIVNCCGRTFVNEEVEQIVKLISKGLSPTEIVRKIRKGEFV